MQNNMETSPPEGEEDATKRENNSYSIQDVFQALNETQRFRKSDQVDTAQICLDSRKIQLLSNKTNIGRNYGYALGGKPYLYPEEALYFLEIFKLEILLDKIPLSVERSRSLLIRSDIPAVIKFDGSTCSVSEYTVYKYLAKQGYRLRRPNYVFKLLAEAAGGTAVSGDNLEELPEEPLEEEMNSVTDEPMQVANDGNMNGGNDSDKVVGSEEHGQDNVSTPGSPSNSSPSNGKRKIPKNSGVADVLMGKRPKFKVGESPEKSEIGENEVPGSSSKVASSDSSTSPEIICDYECINDPASVKVTYYSDNGEETIYELDPASFYDCSSSYSEEPQPSTSRGPQNYTVEEADSDVEFVDEVIFSGVDIEELPPSDVENELPDIPEASGFTKEHQSTSFTTLRSPTKDHVFVDLVSSDDEDDGPENNALKNFSDRIWSQFVPQPTTAMAFPPEELIPKEIRRSNKDLTLDTYAKFDDDCDLELKEIVDGLKLDSDSDNTYNKKKSQRNRAKSWKDWRRQEAQDIQDVFHESLFGAKKSSNDLKAGSIDCDKTKIFNCWTAGLNSPGGIINDSNLNGTNSLEKSYAYDLYRPSENKFSKNVLGTQVKPSYRVIIKQETDVFLDFNKLTCRKDEIPYLIAIVNEDQQVTFVSPGNSDIQDLFRSSNSNVKT